MRARSRDRVSRLWTWLYRREKRAYGLSIKATSTADALHWRRISERLYRLMNLLRDSV